MKIWWLCLTAVVALLAALFAASVSAGLCSDTDDGPQNPSNPSDDVLSTKGSVKYGLTTLVDTCLSSKGGVSASEGSWLREYFCEDDKREYKDYKCEDYGFQKCDNGKCVNKGSSSQQNKTNQTKKNFCGDHNIDKTIGEECDPPGSICFGKVVTEYGQCSASCKCEFVHKSEAQEVCGNGVLEQGEDCEFNSDCAEDEICDLCICAPSPIAQNATNQTSQGAANATNQAGAELNATTNATVSNWTTENKTEFKVPEFKAPEIGNVTDFSKEPGIRVASGVARFFMKILNWFVGLFR